MPDFYLDIANLPFKIDISQDELDQQMRDFNKKKSFKKFHGFNTSRDKSRSSQNRYFMTDYLAGYDHVINTKTGKLNKKAVYKPLFNSLHQAFQAIAEQRQVFTGLNHFRRDLVVVDVDCKPAYSLAEHQEAIQSIISKCNHLNIDYPSYIEFHSDSGHYQIGWYLTEYFTNYGQDLRKTSEYRFLTRQLAVLFDGDIAFKGGNIKNPFHEKNNAYFFNIRPVHAETFLLKIESTCSSLEKEEISTGQSVFPTSIIKNNNLYNFDNSMEKSRNCYAYSKAISWVFSYMKNHKGSLPSAAEVEEVFTIFEIESLQYNNKQCIEDILTIRRSVEGVLNFCKSHYSEHKAANVFDEVTAKNRRDHSLIVRQADKAINYFKIKFLLNTKNMTQTQLARAIGCSQATVHNILLKPQEYYIDCLNTFKSLYKESSSFNKQYTLQSIDFIFKNLEDPKNYDLSNFFVELQETS